MITSTKRTIGEEQMERTQSGSSS